MSDHARFVVLRGDEANTPLALNLASYGTVAARRPGKTHEHITVDGTDSSGGCSNDDPCVDCCYVPMFVTMPTSR
jgi:hypothetical protein